MRILDRAVYVGPSLYAHFPVIRLEVDLGPLEAVAVAPGSGRPSSTGCSRRCPGCTSTAAPTASRAGSSAGSREDEGTWMGHILEHVAIELQNVAGEPVTFGKTRGAGARGHYHVVYQYEQEDVGLEAGRLGLTLLHSLLPPELRPEGSVPRRLRLRRRARRVHPLRPAPGARAEHHVAGARGRGAAASPGSGSTSRA